MYGANRYIRTVTRLSVNDCTSGFPCWHGEALARFAFDRVSSEGYPFVVELLCVSPLVQNRVFTESSPRDAVLDLREARAAASGSADHIHRAAAPPHRY